MALTLHKTAPVISQASGLSSRITEQIRFVFFCLLDLQPVQSSPFLLPLASTLKQKMASFQHLMDVVDDEACDVDSDAGGCVKTRGYLSGEATSPPQDD